MSKKEQKRAEIVEKLAVHFLEEGLDETGLRRLAEVAGTSDRMLLYYFENKDDLVAAVLIHIGGGLYGTLEAVFGTEPPPPAKALTMLWEMVKSPDFSVQMRLWLELSSKASRGDPLFTLVSDQLAEGWIAWLATMLDAPEEKRHPLAVLIMGAVDGMVVLFPKDLSRGDAAIEALAATL